MSRKPDRIKKENLLSNIRNHHYLYLMALPGILWLVLFRVIPAGGSIIAFQDYSIFGGLWNSKWVGMQNFRDMVNYHNFGRVFRNTMVIGFQRVVFTFPAPLILALLINEVRLKVFRRSLQTVTYMPHFLSWVIVSQIFINLLSPQGGAVNILLERIFGMDEPIFFMVKSEFFRPIVIISYIWKEMGYESIIYLASLAAIDVQLYEAAAVDGATRWQQLWRITLPSLMPTIVILFLLKVGRFMEIGFDQIWTLSNPLVWEVSDIFDTYVYRKGMLEGAYSLTTAVNLFKTMVSVVLLTSTNWLAKRTTGRSLF